MFLKHINIEKILLEVLEKDFKDKQINNYNLGIKLVLWSIL